MKILIVEDNPANYQLLEKLLKKYGDIEVAVDGQLGLEAFTKAQNSPAPIDLIFLDILMPKMDGHQLLSHIRELEEKKGVGIADQVKVVIASSVSTQESVFKGFDAGALYYLMKPYDKKHLLDLFTALNLEEKKT